MLPTVVQAWAVQHRTPQLSPPAKILLAQKCKELPGRRAHTSSNANTIRGGSQFEERMIQFRKIFRGGALCKAFILQLYIKHDTEDVDGLPSVIYHTMKTGPFDIKL
jgi:hypothetical protein